MAKLGYFSFFWDEKFWFPENINWTHFERDETIFIPHPEDLWIMFPIAIGFFILRQFWERYVGDPIGRAFKLRDTSPTPPVPNKTLEAAFKQHHRIIPKHEQLQGLSKQTDLSTRQIERWWRRRRVQGKASELTRFRETSWRFIAYFCLFYYGVIVLWDKPWFSDTKHCWYGWPRQNVTDEIWWYYMLELGFYWSLVMSLLKDVRRKDFLEHVIHHFVTIFLMVFSWSDNMVRIGTLVLVCHDAVDYWLEGAKLAKYMKFHKLCDVMFVIFTIIWFVTRIVLFPLKILTSSLNEGHHFLGMAPCYYLFNGLMLAITLLNIMWFYYICRTIYGLLALGQALISALENRRVESPKNIQGFVQVRHGVVWSTLYEAHELLKAMSPSYYVYNGLLVSLMVLNTIWFYYISRAAFLYLLSGQVEKDERSETEPDSESEDEQKILGYVKQNLVANGSVGDSSDGPVLRASTKANSAAATSNSAYNNNMNKK